MFPVVVPQAGHHGNGGHTFAASGGKLCLHEPRDGLLAHTRYHTAREIAPQPLFQQDAGSGCLVCAAGTGIKINACSIRHQEQEYTGMDALQRSIHADQLVIGVFLFVEDQALQFDKAQCPPAIGADHRLVHRVYAQIFQITAGDKGLDVFQTRSQFFFLLQLFLLYYRHNTIPTLPTMPPGRRLTNASEYSTVTLY